MGASAQVESVEQTNKAEEMVAVQVADEHARNAAGLGFEPAQLYLAAFATVDQKVMVLNGEQLTGREATVGGSGRVGPQYF